MILKRLFMGMVCLFLFTALPTLTVEAQTQEEIEQMLNGGSDADAEAEAAAKAEKEKQKAAVKAAAQEAQKKAQEKADAAKAEAEEKAAAEGADENAAKAKKGKDKVEDAAAKAEKEAEEKAAIAKEKADKEAAKAAEEAAKLKAKEEAAMAKEKEKAEKVAAESKKEDKSEEAADNTKEELVEKKKNAKEVIPTDTPEAMEEVEAPEEAKPAKTAPMASSSRSGGFKKPLRSWTLGFGGNLVHPYTDIRYKDFFGTMDPVNENQWGAQLRVTKMFDGAFGLMFQAQYNRVQGTFDSLVVHAEDRDYLVNAGINQGVFYRSNVIQGSLNLYWNISNTIFNVNKYNSGKMKPRKFSLYAYSGIGVSVFDPHIMFTSNRAPASFNGITFYDDQSAEIVIPVAIGTKFKLGAAADLGFEYGFNYMFTDKLDAFNFDHPGRVKNDVYSNLSMVLEFKLGTKKKSKEHLEWMNPIEPVYEELASLNKKVKRLSADADEDGVSDFFDKDTDTQEDVTVDGSGRALDVDKDGIPDYADMEPLSDIGAETDEFGISLDDDGDGVPNHKDADPNTADGTFVNFQGESIQDNIDIPDVDTMGTGNGFGLPSVYFDTDLAKIKKEWEDELFLIARTLKRNANLKVTVVGHCDERGSKEYNEALGMRRAQAVIQYLTNNYKIDAAQMTAVSKGKDEMKTNKLHINRRVDVEIVQ